MPPRGSGPELLIDTSVAVALAVADHEHHDATLAAVGKRRLGLAGHAAFEAFSVLTRLPPPMRRTPTAVARLLATNFPHSRFLSSDAAATLFLRLESTGIAGGSVYDALVGAVAAEHGIPLATRDQRAVATYRRFDIELRIIA
jgi:predicted nucleic acid-binding protein